ncbi:putative ABC-type molybdate transporter [Helianthus annuus]|nr:ABC transporter G family member 10 [Helianthus annuus]KAJ0434345.1 putative ABC-type molybdate transporter [Helianthus annuus]KAJ0827059.1 putative ABC-type molybdate transporter [Helianthus annuus]
MFIHIFCMQKKNLRLTISSPLSLHFNSSMASPVDRKSQYTIKAKGISYAVSPPLCPLGWICHNPGLKKKIITNVSCEVKPGEITAVAGPSGAGKTTLLEILAGVIPPCRVSGEVVVNDRTMNPTVFRRVSGYVTQEDLLFPLLTVEETLFYSARLRLHNGPAQSRVSELLVELGLSHVAGERVGDGSGTHRGISGGERRRVSIGVDLVHDPAVLLMDEPTSGLDSAAALQVMSMLKNMAKNHGKTIVLTIHQPGFRILELLDQVVLLADGVVVHHGSLDHLHQRLKLAGHSVPQQVNVLEFSIDVIETLFPDVEQESAGFGLKKQTSKTPLIEELLVGSGDGGSDETRVDLSSVTGDRESGFDHRLMYANSMVTEVMILSQRFCYNIFRCKQLFIAKLVQMMVVGVLLGTIFNNINRFQMQTQIGFFAFNLTYLLYSSSEALPIFLKERRIIMRETSIGAYRISSYTLANALVFILFLLIVALLYATPTYWLVGLRKDLDGFLYFSLVVWLVLLTSNSFVSCFSALVPNFMVGISLVAAVMGSFFLFSGYFISNNDIPKYWRFMHYLSLFRYPFECFLLNEFGGSKGRLRCLQRFENGCLLYGEEFLKTQNIDEIQKWYNLGMMLVFIFGYRFLSFLVLCYKSYRSRN